MSGLVALVCLGATLATTLRHRRPCERYSDVEIGRSASSISRVLAALRCVALRSDRFWPLWVAGSAAHHAASAHLLKAIDRDLLPLAYAAALALWSYPILIILAIGTWRSHRRSCGADRARRPEQATDCAAARG